LELIRASIQRINLTRNEKPAIKAREAMEAKKEKKQVVERSIEASMRSMRVV
jgi:hypothetical protein